MRLCLADGGDWWGGGEAITLTSIPRNSSMGQVCARDRLSPAVPQASQVAWLGCWAQICAAGWSAVVRTLAATGEAMTIGVHRAAA